MNELLRHAAAAPGDPGDVDLIIAKIGDELGAEAGDARGAIGQCRQRRIANARQVKNNRSGISERLKERFCQFPIGANAVEQ